MPLKRLICRAVLLAVGVGVATAWGPISSAGDAPGPRLAVLPFEIKDTSGEVGPANRHDQMLANLTRFVGDSIAASGTFKVAEPARVAEAVAAANPGTYLRACNGCELDIAESIGADAVMIGWVYKVSTLIGTLHVVIKDVPTGNVTYAHVFDFRGDKEKAWHRAADYMVQGLKRRTKNDAPPTN